MHKWVLVVVYEWTGDSMRWRVKYSKSYMFVWVDVGLLTKQLVQQVKPETVTGPDWTASF